MKQKLENVKLAIIGLGYVGLPLAVEFSKKYSVIGYDVDGKRIKELKKGIDFTNEISEKNLLNSKTLKFTNSKDKLISANIFIITVPTPVDKNNKPNLNPIQSASSLVGTYLKENDLVIYESTVFPGCTEEVCVPILEQKSKLVYNKDFFCGYSPERINPGDKINTITTIKKITSGSNYETASFVDSLYRSIITAGTCRVSSIAVAEAAKVIENTQRDVNIALVNELSLIFNRLNLDTREVLDAASTKWNFLSFYPGLVGGHCIGVDPYYLTHKAFEVGYHPEMILAGRRINDNMGYFIAEKTISELTKQGIGLVGAKIAILGLTFKENCPDLRNTKVITIIEQLREYQCQITVSDCWANGDEVKKSFNFELTELNDIKDQDSVIIAVGHDEHTHFKSADWSRMLRSNGVLIDVKSIYNHEVFKGKNIKYWRL
mgnify:CR=1 FL=1